MGIERLTSTLLKEAEEESKRIVQDAQRSAEEMMKEEMRKWKEMRKEAEEEVRRMLEEQRNERLAWARLEGKRMIADAKEDAIKEAIDAIYELAPEIRKSKEYREFLSRKVEEAVAELGSGVVVHVLKGEGGLISSKVRILEDLDALGGAVVESKDGRVRVDLRLETIFELRSDELRREISSALFKAEGSEKSG